MIEIKSKKLREIMRHKDIIYHAGRRNGNNELHRIIAESVAYVEQLESEVERLTKLLAKVGDGS